MKNKNVITHIQDHEGEKIVLDIFKTMDLWNISIDNYEELFHTLIHIKPKLLVVEVNNVDEPYIKVIQMLNKAIITNEVPILVLTTSKDTAFFQQLATLDLLGIVQAPFRREIIEIEIKNSLRLGQKEKSIGTTQDLEAVQTVMISSLASLTEYHDPETGEHVKRTQNYVKALAITLKNQGFFLDELTSEAIEAIYMAVPLHDIGKIGVRDDILMKPGELTEEEYEEVKKHTTLGYEAIKKVSSRLDENSFLCYASDIAYTHHERYDGTGYPRQLKGDEIPLVGRLMAVADVYDALVSKRIYKVAMTHEEAMDIILTEKGTHFDPRIVDCAIGLERTFENIAHTYSDTEHSGDESEHHLLRKLHEQGFLNRILVVEDSEMVSRMMKNQFQSIGITTDVALDGMIALEMILDQEYDLVLLDIELPRLTGYELVKVLKEENKLPTVIAMTATDYTVTLQEIREKGMEGLILKPVDFRRLGAKFAEILRKKRMR